MAFNLWSTMSTCSRPFLSIVNHISLLSGQLQFEFLHFVGENIHKHISNAIYLICIVI